VAAPASVCWGQARVLDHETASLFGLGSMYCTYGMCLRTHTPTYTTGKVLPVYSKTGTYVHILLGTVLVLELTGPRLSNTCMNRTGNALLPKHVLCRRRTCSPVPVMLPQSDEEQRKIDACLFSARGTQYVTGYLRSCPLSTTTTIFLPACFP
jgi:hypothetical protein